MSDKIKTLCWRTALISIETVAVVAVLLALVVGIAAWRLSSGPFDMGFAKDYIEQALVDSERGTHVTMENLVLQWPDLKGPLLLGLEDVKLIGENGEEILAVNEAALSLSKANLLIGRIAPLALILREPSLRVIKDENGELDIGFSVQGDTFEEIKESEEDQGAITDKILEYIAQPGTKAGSDSPLSTLKALQIEAAHLYFEDRKNNLSWSLPNLNLAIQSIDEGLKADLYLPLAAAPAEMPPQTEQSSEDTVPADIVPEAGTPAKDTDKDFAYIEGSYMFAWDNQNLNAYTKIKNFDLNFMADKSPDLSMLAKQNVVFDAEIFAMMDPDLNPIEAKLSVTSVAGSFYAEDLSLEPVPYSELVINALYTAEQQKLKVQEASVTIGDIPVKAEASLKHTDSSVSGPVKLTVDRVQHAQIGPLWPEFLRGDSSEEWIVKKMSDGVFTNVFASLDFEAQKIEQEDGTIEWQADAHNIEAGFAFENLSVDYRDPLFAVTQGVGHGILDENEDLLRIVIESGKIRDITVKGGELKFYDVIAVGKGSAEIDTEVTGPLRTVIDYVSQEPIELEHDFDLSRMTGTADLKVNVAFPTQDDIPIEEVKVQVDGTVSNATLPGVVQGLDLTGGPFTVAVKGNSIDVQGTGKLADRPVKARYEAFLNADGQAYESRATATLIADPALREHFGVNLKDFIEGSSPIAVTYTEYAGGRSEADIQADLTPVRAFVTPFDYEKPIGGQASASLKVLLQNGEAKEVRGLTASAPNLTLESTQLVFRKSGQETELAQGKVSRFVIGETVGTLDFDIAPSGDMKFIMNTPYFDARPFMNDDGSKVEPYTSPPMRISLSADRMRTDDEQTVQYGKVYIDIDNQGRFNQFEVDAIAGKGNVYLRYKPETSGKRTFRLEADDAGAALKAFGVYDKIQGGKMVIYGEPIRGVNDRNLKGVAELTNFKVVDAPALAKLLSTMSLPGILSALNNEGVTFSKLESQFDWLYRPGGSLLVLSEGRTAGNALGLTFDGTFDNKAKTMDVSGTIVPISGVNNFIGDIPLLGDLLTGGSGSVFAATYTMKGDAKNPETFVNPLAVLAPGIVRRILFE